MSRFQYYDRLKRPISSRQAKRNLASVLVKAAHRETRLSYGHKSLHAHLATQSHDISCYMVRSIKHAEEVHCKRHKRFKVTTNSDHDKPVFDNC